MSGRLDDVSAMLERVCYVGRSSRHALTRRRVFGAAGAAALPSPLATDDAAEAARRARALRLSGRDADAAAGFERALRLAPDLAEAVAYRWEAAWTPGSSSAGIEKAMSLDPGEPLWAAWAGLAAMTARRGDLGAREARGLFERSLELGPSALAWAGLAMAELDARRPAAAAAAAGRAVSLEGDQAWLYRLRARARQLSGDEKGFLEDCRRDALLDEGVGTLCEALPAGVRRPAPRLLDAVQSFLKKRPDAVWLLVVRADCRRSPEINDFAGALDDLRAAAEAEPGVAYVHAYLCRALMVAGRTDEARASIDRAIALAPESGWIRVWRGELERRLGDVRAALADFDAGLRLDPDYEMGYSWRGGARRAAGRLDEAVADLDVGAGLDPNYAWTFAERSLAQRQRGRVKEALADLRAAAKLDPKHVWCSRPKDRDAALAQLDAALAADPRDAWALAWRGETRLRFGDAAGAARDLRRATGLDPELAWARVWLGQALAALGKNAEAMKAFDAGVALDASYPPALAERGALRLALGNARAAWKDLSRAAAAGPLSARIWSLKGEAALRLGLWERAAGDFSQALELERGWRPRVGRAKAYERLGRFAEARADLEVPLMEALRLSREGRAADAAALRDEAFGAPRRPSAALERRMMAPWLGGTQPDAALPPWCLVAESARAAAAGDHAAAVNAAEGFRLLLPDAAAGPAMLALLSAQAGDREGAQRFLKELPARGWTRALRGLLRSRWGDAKGALADLEATRASEKSAWAVAARADVYEELGRLPEALAEVSALRRLLPGSPETKAREAALRARAEKRNYVGFAGRKKAVRGGKS